MKIYFGILQVSNKILVWHVSPVHADVQVHTKPRLFPSDIQTPLFWHGFDKQALAGIWQFVPLNPCAQIHLKFYYDLILGNTKNIISYEYPTLLLGKQSAWFKHGPDAQELSRNWQPAPTYPAGHLHW